MPSHIAGLQGHQPNNSDRNYLGAENADMMKVYAALCELGAEVEALRAESLQSTRESEERVKRMREDHESPERRRRDDEEQRR